MVLLIRSFLVVMPTLLWGGCHNPARQNVPRVAPEQTESEWRKELAPGLRADRALGYLLTHGFDCQVTRDENAQVLRILATQPNLPDGVSSSRRKRQINITIQEDKIQTVNITPQ